MIAEGSVLAARDTLRDYLVDFWDDGKSEYLRSRRAEGRAHNSVYVRDNRAKMEKYVLPYFEARGITRLSDLDRQRQASPETVTLESQQGARGVLRGPAMGRGHGHAPVPSGSGRPQGQGRHTEQTRGSLSQSVASLGGNVCPQM